MEQTSGNKLLEAAVKVGAALPFNMYAQNGMLLLGRGHYVLTDEQRARLLQHVATPAAGTTLPVAPAQTRARARDINPFEELLHAAQRLDGLQQQALQVPDFSGAVRKLAHDLTDLADFMPDAMIAALLLAPLIRYSATHSVHVAILLALISRRLDLSKSERHSLLCAALTMNIAIAPLMDTLHAQETPLLPAQRQQIDIHPVLGSAILRAAGVSDEHWHALVQSHHEQWDGSGYPLGLLRPDIPAQAHLIHLADLAAAKLTPRSYRQALLSQQALAQIFRDRETLLDAHYAALLVKELGIYPPGSFVRLVNGEIAVVVARRDKANEPYVAALRKEDQAPYAAPLLRETRLPQFAVCASVNAACAGVRTAYLAPLWRCRRED
ncbi:HD-GYP domain-containing protein [Craterilacuibacter sp.]|uniref:HD-GYP domain-containing protein n=1 Tax=Craterilacuibacter sp. TaxID=2870909 RepID=UPI003F39CDF3